jgi:hypothetical protein
MTVKELITELNKCNPDDLVMFNMENSMKNEDITLFDAARKEVCELDFSVDDVLIGSGTIRGFVFLTEELLPDDKAYADKSGMEFADMPTMDYGA